MSCCLPSCPCSDGMENEVPGSVLERLSPQEVYPGKVGGGELGIHPERSDLPNSVSRRSSLPGVRRVPLSAPYLLPMWLAVKRGLLLVKRAAMIIRSHGPTDVDNLIYNHVEFSDKIVCKSTWHWCTYQDAGSLLAILYEFWLARLTSRVRSSNDPQGCTLKGRHIRILELVSQHELVSQWCIEQLQPISILFPIKKFQLYNGLQRNQWIKKAINK